MCHLPIPPMSRLASLSARLASDENSQAALGDRLPAVPVDHHQLSPSTLLLGVGFCPRPGADRVRGPLMKCLSDKLGTSPAPVYPALFPAFVAPDPGRQGKAWDVWYKFLTENHGLAEKAAFVGMSKGGVNAFNWGGVNLPLCI